jgi:hypothetical protein
MSDFYVEIRPYSDDQADPGFRRMGPFNRHHAERVESGANINLNHTKYYTIILEEPQP